MSIRKYQRPYPNYYARAQVGMDQKMNLGMYGNEVFHSCFLLHPAGVGMICLVYSHLRFGRLGKLVLMVQKASGMVTGFAHVAFIIILLERSIRNAVLQCQWLYLLP